MGAGVERCSRDLAGVDRAIVFDEHHRLGGLSGLWPVKPVELLELGDKVAACLGLAGMDDELAGDVIERTEDRDLPGLPRRWHPQVGPHPGPDTGEIGMGERLALVAVVQNDIARFGLLLAQSQTRADPFDLGSDLALLQRVPRPPPAELVRNALDNCDWLMRTPSRASISARRRGSVQFGRSATGSSSSGRATRNAASLFTEPGRRHPGLQRLHSGAREIAPSKPNRVFTHAKGFRDPWARPAYQRQQHRTGPVRFPRSPDPFSRAISSLNTSFSASSAAFCAVSVATAS